MAICEKVKKVEFLLRIEDTDAKRSNDQTTENIIRDLKWLNINWDEDIVYQKENIDKHKEVINNLLRSGHAYHCYCNEQEINELKSAKESNSLKALRSPWRDKINQKLTPDLLSFVSRHLKCNLKL